jgi:ferredoxin
MPYVVTEQCIQCGACVAGCPTGAAKEGESRSYIDVSICIECGTCEQNCPVMAIIFVEDTDESAPQAKN